MTQSPYKAENKGSYWVLVDTRTGNLASYPTTKGKCKKEEQFMNEQYQKILSEIPA